MENTDKTSSILEDLAYIQANLVVPKSRYSDFGDYNYRKKEDITQAVKPFLEERGLVLLLNDEVKAIQPTWIYIETTATLMDSHGGKISAVASAREEEMKKKSSSSQLTGSAASYAGKRALCNLFNITDDELDPDEEQPVLVGHCEHCGTEYSFESKQHMDEFFSNPFCCDSPYWVVGPRV